MPSETKEGMVHQDVVFCIVEINILPQITDCLKTLIKTTSHC